LLLAAGWESLAGAVGLRRGAKLVSAFSLLGLIQIGNLSGEWLAGGIEAKVPAYGLVFLALSQAVAQRWTLVWPLVGVAAGFHVLVGGWSALALGLARVLAARNERVPQREMATLAAGMIFLLAFGVVPAIGPDWSASSTIRMEAATIYVRQRLSHHLYFWDFPRSSILLFAAMVIAWRELQRHYREGALRVVNHFAGAAIAFVTIGIGLSAWSASSWHPDWADSLLRFYWFRLADVAVPAAIALMATQPLHVTGAAKANGLSSRWRVLSLRGLVLAGGIGWLSAGLVHWSDARPGADRQSLPTYPDNPVRTRDTYANWVRVCRWIDRRTPSDALFLTPRQQQTFHWYARRAEFVNWKNIPQNAAAILDWRTRMDVSFGVNWDWPQLALVSRGEWADWLNAAGVDFVVMEQALWLELSETGPTDPLRQVYPEFWDQRATYVVLRVDRQDPPVTPDGSLHQVGSDN
jgi:hypothetical protein